MKKRSVRSRTPSPEARLLSFPPYRLDLDAERLWRGDKEIQLRRKPFAILRYLVQKPQRLVTHAEIVEAVWGKIAMSESLLRTHVHDLRSALGEGVVETVVGRGYRFIAEISHLHEGDREPPGRSDSAIASTGARVVGREAEIGALQAALRSARNRRRTMVFVSGEAGVGKTTLVDAFLDEASSKPALVGRGACVEQIGTGQAYLPVFEAVGALCRGRGGSRAIDAFAEHAPTWLAQMPGLVTSARFAEVQRRASGGTPARSLRELGQALDALSTDEPVVLVFEDLHWTDPSTAELLAFMGGRREPARVLIVGTYRGGEVPRGHPLTRVTGELIAHRHASSIMLDGLPIESIDAYLSKRFAAHDFPADVAKTLHQTTNGNSLFFTTLVDDLEEQGLIRERNGRAELATSIEEVAARRPESIRRLIDTQIDRLAPVEQSIVEAAAVMGMTFSAGVVAFALDADADSVDSTCESLANERKLLRYIGTETWPDGTVQTRYAFGHSLFQHAALMRSTAAVVRARHRKIGERIETGYAQYEDRVLAELAAHFDRGCAPAKAARYYLMAGDRAARQHELPEAIAHYARVSGVAPYLPEGRERDLFEAQAALGQGWRLFQRDGSTEVAVPTLERAREIATRVGDKGLLAETLIRLEALDLVRGDLPAASDHAEELAPLRDLASDPLRTFAEELEAITVLLRGDLHDACSRFEELGIFRVARGETAPEVQGTRMTAMALGAHALWLTGQPDLAVTLVSRGYQAAEKLNDRWERAALLSDWATVHAWRREPAKARALAERSLALADEGAFGLWTRRADLVLRWAEAELEPSLPRERAVQLMTKPWEGVSFGRTLPSLLFATLCARLGHTDKALEVIGEALTSIEESNERWLEPELRRFRGELLHPKEAAEAERSVTRAIELAREQSSVSLELRATLTLYAISSGTKKKRARGEIARALSGITGGADAPDVVEARTVLNGA